jgi:hypothetical protein
MAACSQAGLLAHGSNETLTPSRSQSITRRSKHSGRSVFSPITAAVLRRIRTDFPFHLQANGGT